MLPIKELLSLLTIISQIFLVLLFSKKLLKKARKHSLQLSLIISLTAMLGSLFFSEIMLYDPCKLCWYQRILMYPLVLIFTIAIIKKANPRKYVIPMSIIGALLAGYHYLITILPSASTVCGEGTSCLIQYFTSFGYVTIPMMSLTAFILIIVLMWKKN